MPDWMPWVLAAAAVAFFVYNRIVGARAGREARALVAAGARIVDVRSPGEFAGGHLDGALNIPVEQIASRAGEVGAKDAPVVLYCRSGARSAAAARALRERGFTRILNLGAMSNW